MPDDKMLMFCECPSYNCHCRILLAEETYLALQAAGQIAISNQCVCPPLSGDVLVEQREGYRVYRPDPAPKQEELDRLP